MTTPDAAWPESVAARYRQEGYWAGTPLGDLLRSWARRDPDGIAIVDGDVELTYAAIDRMADRMAAGLVALGLRRGDRVVVQLPNIFQFVPLAFAMLRIGVLPVFALAAHRRSEIVHLANSSAAVAYVIPARHQGFDYRGLAAEVEAATPTLRHVIVAGAPGAFTGLDTIDAEPVALAPPAPSDVAFFLLSGGTTGLPKLIPRTHDDYAYNIRVCTERAGLTARTVYLAVLPIAHNFALGCPGVLGTLSVGGKVVLSSAASADEAFELIEREKVTVSALVPPLAVLWMEAAQERLYDLSSLELVQVGGARFKPEHARRFRPLLGCRLQHSFGMAEGMLIQTRPSDPDEVAANTQGQPVSPADEMRIVDDLDRDVAPGEIGHLLARGPYTIRGYHGVPEYNRRAFTASGFFRTGDLAQTTPTGHVVILGRANDVINRGGEKISAEEVEAHLLSHPDIVDAAIVAMSDELMGERGCAFVVTRGARLAAAQVAAFLTERGLAAYKLPDRIEQLDVLPSTSVGKVDKAKLRALIAAMLQAAPDGADAAARVA